MAEEHSKGRIPQARRLATNLTSGGMASRDEPTIVKAIQRHACIFALRKHEVNISNLHKSDHIGKPWPTNLEKSNRLGFKMLWISCAVIWHFSTGECPPDYRYMDEEIPHQDQTSGGTSSIAREIVKGIEQYTRKGRVGREGNQCRIAGSLILITWCSPFAPLYLVKQLWWEAFWQSKHFQTTCIATASCIYS